LTDAILTHWQQWAALGAVPIWPKNDTSEWILRRTFGKENGGMVALGIMQPTPGAEEELLSLQDKSVHLVSWPLLARELRRVIPREFMIIITSLLSLLLLLLIIAFRNGRDLVLMTFTMVLVFLSLMGAMRMLGMNWNAFNIASIMLLLGTGTDYSIYVILSLNRNGGNIAETQRFTGLVIFLCAGSAVAGFGTLGWAGHRGLASLGQVCALGLALDAIITVFLLPVFWDWWRGRSRSREPSTVSESQNLLDHGRGSRNE
jgi:predicted RND superfamily exporter protein